MQANDPPSMQLTFGKGVEWVWNGTERSEIKPKRAEWSGTEKGEG